MKDNKINTNEVNLKPNRTNIDLYIFLIFFVVAVSIRLYRIGNFELWLDEAFTYHEMVTTDFLASLLNDNSPPLYYIILRGWGAIAGYSETAIRMPSAIFGGLFVATIYVAAKNIFDKKIGIWCGVLALLSPIHIYYSQEARCYSLFLLLILLTYWMVWKAQESNSVLFWSLSGLFATISLYTHTLAFISLFATISFIIFSSNISRKLVYNWFLYVLLVPFILFLPWVIFSLFVTNHSEVGADWIKYIWAKTPVFLAIPMSLDAFSFLTSLHVFNVKVGGFDSYNRFMETGINYIVRIFLAILLIGNALPFYNNYIASNNTSRKKYMFYLALLLPLTILLIISTVKPLYVVSRYDLIGYPAFVILIGLAFSKIQSRAKVFWNPLLLLSIVLWFVPSIIFIYYYEKIPRIFQNSPRAFTIKSLVANNDIVVFTGEKSFQQLYYLDMYGFKCRNWSCVDTTGTVEFYYRFFPLANEHSGGAYNERAYLRDPQQKVASEWDQILNMRKSTTSNLFLNCDALLIGMNNIIYRYPLDQILVNTIHDRNIKMHIVSDAFPIILCDTLQR